MKLFVAMWVVTAAAFAQPAKPDPAKVTIGEVDYVGTGCPEKSVTVALSADRSQFLLTFDKLTARTGPGVDADEAQRSCRIRVGLTVPPGWQYSVHEGTFRGYVNLPAGARALFKTQYWAEFEITKVPSAVDLRGPMKRNYVREDNMALQVPVWSECGLLRNTMVEAQVKLTAPAGAAAEVSADTTTGKVTQSVGLKWQRCRGA